VGIKKNTIIDYFSKITRRMTWKYINSKNADVDMLLLRLWLGRGMWMSRTSRVGGGRLRLGVVLEE
jgi:hypothetical protein